MYRSIVYVVDLSKCSSTPRLIYLMLLIKAFKIVARYSHLFNKRGACNKRGGVAKFAKSLNVEVGINVEGGIFWKKLVHNSNKRGVEGGKI